ncbi:tail fiber assembly protein [Providencia stuartii]|uniref:Caudovirales tail fiber assembly protein n=1 Tax=Providencia stuartii ATCC 25827 TaxID=471874 RepID=A0AA86YXG1_PROST|nr:MULTISPECIES: tail fiber assembly protein [Providencia]EDU59858.1 caudovirales tail fiber assembly protein [Providencia stuartii ATCC 25827]MBS7783550.1 tail fiber assembly protein [Providencia thailandensis]MTC83292.1 tail fiber assembly protein [Providencia stuartii]MTC93700.1 tail fiber assembly protein [Providencia stuartii]OMH53140.1 phage tail protein [Providencia stuartii]
MKNYNLEIEQAEIGQNGLATKAGWIKTYIADPTTREYLNANMEYIYFDVSVSAGAYTDAPELPTKTGFAVVRSEDGSKWEIVTDNRGKTAYSTETRQPIEVDFIGDLPETLTLLEPKTEFDAWNGKKWVTDTEAQKAALIAQAEQEKSQRLDEANNMLTYLQDSIDTGLATDEEAAALQAWKKYRVLLNRVDTSLAPNIEWPEKP